MFYLIQKNLSSTCSSDIVSLVSCYEISTDYWKGVTILLVLDLDITRLVYVGLEEDTMDEKPRSGFMSIEVKHDSSS